MTVGTDFAQSTSSRLPGVDPLARATSGPRIFSPRVLGDLLRALDLLLLVGGGRIGIALFDVASGTGGRGGEEWLATVVGSYVCVVVLARSGTYRVAALRRLRVQLPALARALPAGIAACYVCQTVIAEALPPPGGAVFWALACATAFVAAHGVLAERVRGWIASDRLTCRTAIVGVNAVAHRFIEHISNSPETATRVVGVYDDRPPELQTALPGLAVAGDVGDLIERSRDSILDAIVIAVSLGETHRARAIAEQFGSAVADIYLLTDMSEVAATPGAGQFAGTGTLLIAAQPMKDWRALKKATFDYVLAILLLLPLSPLMLIVAVAIKLDTPGPVLFRQPRLGFNNCLFDVYKFRTMYHHLTDRYADRQTTRGDPRITAVGRWLRRFSIDEFPQLFNVLRGEMSLVGPRPHAPNTKAGGQLFGDAVASYANRHRVKPGITGWAQVNGFRGETATVLQLEHRIAHDLYYIDNWSLLFDIRIIILTALREINSRQAF